MTDNNHHRSTIEVMESHVTVRRFTDEPITHDLLETLIQAGTRASTSSNMQGYTIISVTVPEHKKRLAALCADQQQIHESAAFLLFCADLHRLELCAQKHDVAYDDLGNTESFITAIVDVALVMENVAVAAESVGLGMCMIGSLRNFPFDVREVLGLPRYVVPVSGVCLGWPAEEHDSKPRLPLDAVWHRERYRDDEDLKRSIDAYDGIMAAFNDSQGRHPDNPRWSKVMCDVLDKMAQRTEIGRFAQEQGFNSQ